MKKFITLLLCLCMVLALFTACGSKEEAAKTDTGKSETKTDIPQPAIAGGSATGGNEIIEADAYKETFRIGGQMEFPTLDFQTSLNAYYVVTMTHDTLITMSDGEFVPALATEWNMVNDKQWEFKLREGVKFHDGSPFTAEDVVYTFERGMVVTGSTLAPHMISLDKVEAKDDYTVDFYLTDPDQDFLLSLSTGYSSIMSKTAMDKDSENGFQYGTGPWKVTNFKPSLSVTMERYDDFWGEAPKTKIMEYVTYPEDASRLVALQSGDVDCCLVVNAADNASCESDPNIVPVTILDSGFAFLAFNLKDELLSDINLRKAICYAINPEDVLAVSCEGYGVPIASFWGGGAYGETDDIEGFYYDPELAKEYLAKSNYKGEELVIMCGVQEYVTNATIFADMLAEVGINCVLDEKDFVGILSSANYDTAGHQMLSFAATWPASGDWVRNYIAEGKRNNYTCIPHPELEEKVNAALYEADDATRKEMYKEIQQTIIDEALYLPVYRSTYYCAEALNCGGIVWSSDCAAYNFRYACIALVD